MAVSKEKIDLLVLDHLVQECHEKAAYDLIKELSPDILTSANYDTENLPHSMTSVRRLIKHSIYTGKIDDAILIIKLHFPSVLDTNNLLHFTLLRLSLIEIIRIHKMEHPANCPEEIEREFLDRVLSFVHNNLISKVAHSSTLFGELELTMSLLCFRFDPDVTDVMNQPDFPAELKALFSYSLRYQCYARVNNAILEWFNQHGCINGRKSGMFTGAAASVHSSSYDGQSSEFSGPSYGVGFGAPTYSLDTSTNESQAAQGSGSFKYKVSVPRKHLATETLDRMKVSRTSTERLFGTKDSEADADDENTTSCETNLESIRRLWFVTERLLNTSASLATTATTSSASTG